MSFFISNILYVDKEKTLIAADKHVGTKLENHVINYDNSIEHFMFVAKEIELWPSRKSYWRAKVYRALDRLDGDAPKNLVKDDILIHWAFATLILGCPKRLLQHLDKLVQSFDLGIKSKSFQYNIQRALGNKGRLKEVFSKELFIPNDLLEFDDL